MVTHGHVPTEANVTVLSQTRTPNLNLYSMQGLYSRLLNFVMPSVYFGDVPSVEHPVWGWTQSRRSRTSTFFLTVDSFSNSNRCFIDFRENIFKTHVEQ